MKLTGTIVINAPPEFVWHYIFDFDNVLKWFTSIKKIEYIDKKSKIIGSKFYWIEKIGNKTNTITFKIIKYEHNRLIEFIMISGKHIKKCEEQWKIDQTKNGSKFFFTNHIEFSWGPFGKIIEILMKNKSQSECNKLLHNLKKIVEKNYISVVDK